VARLTPAELPEGQPCRFPDPVLSAQSDTLPLISVDDYADNFIAQLPPGIEVEVAHRECKRTA
jgi:hypothetical protein